MSGKRNDNKRVKRKLLKLLTLVGCFSTGLIYGSIGVIAILSFLKLKRGGADESSFFVLLNSFAAGRLLIWVIIGGAIAFIIWRFYEAFHDPYKIGRDTHAMLVRAGAAFSSGADAFIALSALQAIFSRQKALVSGEPVNERQMVTDLLERSGGQWLIIATAFVIMLTAAVLLFYGLSKRFTEAIKSEHFSKSSSYITHSLAYAGYFSRGVILGIIGFFLLKAALTGDSGYVVNTDKAFDFLGDHVGAVAYWLIALGTLCYGLYMFVLGLNYDIDPKN